MAPVFVWCFVIDSAIIGFLRCEALAGFVLRAAGAGMFLVSESGDRLCGGTVRGNRAGAWLVSAANLTRQLHGETDRLHQALLP